MSVEGVVRREIKFLEGGVLHLLLRVVGTMRRRDRDWERERVLKMEGQSGPGIPKERMRKAIADDSCENWCIKFQTLFISFSNHITYI